MKYSLHHEDLMTLLQDDSVQIHSSTFFQINLKYLLNINDQQQQQLKTTIWL